MEDPAERFQIYELEQEWQDLAMGTEVLLQSLGLQSF